MKTVLVTGAGGYIGSVLVPKLLKLGYRVKALDRFFFGADKLTHHQNLQIIKDDVRKIAPEIFKGSDSVIDLVAISNDPSGELFGDFTYQINHISRKNNAQTAKKYGVKKYILPSSCSIYGFQDKDISVNEKHPTNPLTTYAKANGMAERDVLKLADKDFCVTVIRQATVFGLSPLMRFDLAINGMTWGAATIKKIPLMRDGTQWRPMVHVQDTTDFMCLLLESKSVDINGEIFNVGSNSNNYQLKELANEVIKAMPFNVEIEWYGDPDNRSYKVSFDKAQKKLGWTAKKKAVDGALEIYKAIQKGNLTKSTETLTLEWYNELIRWHSIISSVEMYNGIMDIK